MKDKSFQGQPDDLSGLEIISLIRRAKILQIQLSNDLHLLTHLKMTGQLIYVDDTHRVGGGHPTADWIRKLPSLHTRIVYTFTDGSHLFFNDQRMFGWMKLVDGDGVSAEFSSYGPDVTDQAVDEHYLIDKFQRRTIAIKQAIMMNEIMAGLGNIYACDALNLAQISPFRPAGSLTEADVARLLAASKQVLHEGIERGGTTFDGAYVDSNGLAGSYQDIARVYGREGEHCLQCGGTIVKTKLGGRGTYYCQQCQG